MRRERKNEGDKENEEMMDYSRFVLQDQLKRMDVYGCVLVQLRKGKKRKKKKRKERRERDAGNGRTGKARGNREIIKGIKEKEKQRRIGIDFGH